MTRPVSLADLEHLGGEVLPPRTVLSVVDLTVNNGPGAGAVSSSPAPAAGGGGADHPQSCTTTSSPGTPGLLGSLGLGSSQPHTSVTCVPTSGSSG